MTRLVDIKLGPKELVFLSRLYLDEEFPYNFLVNQDAMKILDCSKATVITLTKRLEVLGLIERETGGYVAFYYPVKKSKGVKRCVEIRRMVMNRIQGK